MTVTMLTASKGRMFRAAQTSPLFIAQAAYAARYPVPSPLKKHSIYPIG